jgi:hypothetical protein
MATQKNAYPQPRPQHIQNAAGQSSPQ